MYGEKNEGGFNGNSSVESDSELVDYNNAYELHFQDVRPILINWIRLVKSFMFEAALTLIKKQ